LDSTVHKAALPFGIPSSVICGLCSPYLLPCAFPASGRAAQSHRFGNVGGCIFDGASRDPYAPATWVASVGADIIRPPDVPITPIRCAVGAGLDPPAVTPSFFAERSRPFPTADANFRTSLVGRGLAPAAISHIDHKCAARPEAGNAHGNV